MKTKYILGVKIDYAITLADVVELVDTQLLKDGKSHYICTTNPSFIMEAQKDSRFREIINNADLSVPDGVGVIYAIRYLEGVSSYKRNIFFPLRALAYALLLGLRGLLKGDIASQGITGGALTDSLCSLAAKNNYSVFFLGGRERNWRGKPQSKNISDMATRAAQNIVRKYDNLTVIGATSQFSPQPSDDAATIGYIRNSMKQHRVDNVDMMFIAYGQNKQESWIARNKTQVPAKVSIGIGRILDYMSSHRQSPPPFVLRIGVGWVYSLFIEPWRIKRVISSVLAFPLKVFLASISQEVY